MRCTRVRRFLPLYSDGRLAPRHRRALDEHLAACAACREELEGLEQALGLLRRLPALRPPADFKRTIINGVRKADYERRKGQEVRVPLFAPRWAYAAAAVALILAGFAAGRYTHQGTEPTVAVHPGANLPLAVTPVVAPASGGAGVTGSQPDSPSPEVDRPSVPRHGAAHVRYVPTPAETGTAGVRPKPTPGPEPANGGGKPAPPPGTPVRVVSPRVVEKSPNNPDRMTPSGLVFAGLPGSGSGDVKLAGGLIVEDTIARQVGATVLDRMLADPAFAEMIANEIGTPDWRKTTEGPLYATGDSL